MRTTAFLTLLLFSSLSAAIADDFDAKPVQHAIEKAIPWLEKDMVAWRSNNGCAACHHGPMYVWSIGTAKRAGYAINEAQFQDYAKWLIESPDDLAFVNSYGLRWDARNETAYPSTFIIDSKQEVTFAKITQGHGDRSKAADVLNAITGK